MKKTIFVLSLVLLSFPSARAGGSEVGNGGGLAEKNLLFAYTNLPKFISLCLETPLCRLSADEKTLLEGIGLSLSKEQEKVGQLVFQTSSDFFKIDGLIRIAKTGNRIGDPIYLNSDLLYTATGPGQFKALDIPMALSILIHELGHHQGVQDHARLDLLGTKMQILAMTDSQRADFWNGNASLRTFQFNHVHADADKNHLLTTDQIVLENGGELHSLTEEILKTMPCKALRLYNVHETRGVQFDAKTSILRKPFEAWYIQGCVPGQVSDHGNLKITLSFYKKADGLFDFRPAQTKIQKISCRDDSRVCK
jgi:hypothetical protein